MTEIVFASNNKSHWPFSNITTTAGKFDSARVPYGIELKYKEYITSPTWVPLAGNITWVHFRLFINSVEYSDASPPLLISVYDINDNRIFHVVKKPGTFDHLTTITLYDGTTSDSVNQSAPFTNAVQSGVDFKYEADGINTNVKMYVNGGLVATVNIVGATTLGQPAYMVMGGAMVEDDQTSTQVMSEFIVGDSDTRNGRLDLLRPVAIGGETDWVGLATALSDDDPTTGMTTLLADQRQTLDLTAYTGATNISALIVTSQSFAGANGPQNMRHTVRMSAVNYDSPADLPLEDVLHYGLTDFEVNPATSLPWVSGDLSGLEIGFVSKA